MPRPSATPMHVYRWAPRAQILETAPVPATPAHAVVERRLARKSFDTVLATGTPPTARPETRARVLLEPDEALVALCRALCRSGVSVLRHAREYDGMVCAQTTRRGRLAMVRQLRDLWDYTPEDHGLQLYLRHALGASEPLDVSLPSQRRLAEVVAGVDGVDLVADPSDIGPDREVFVGPSTLVEVDGARFEPPALAALLERCRVWDAAGAEVILDMPPVRAAAEALRGWPEAVVQRTPRGLLAVSRRTGARHAQ